MNRKRISRIGKYVLVTMLLTAAPASGWAQRMIKVSGTVYNIADKKKKVPFSGSTYSEAYPFTFRQLIRV